MPDNSPFFIIGSGRSGTTLLRLILAGHSRLHIPPETWYILSLVAELPLIGTLSPSQVERAVDLIAGDYRWPDMEMPAEELRNRAASLPQPSLADIIDIVYRHQLERSGKQRFGDKTPTYIQIVPQLATLYPAAKFIHLIRDGRDVAISRIDLDYDRYYQANFEWTLAMRCRQQLCNGPYAERILELRYEDLVLELEPTVRRVCDFLGEAFEPGMLAWQSLATLIPERERHIHGKIARPVSSAAVAVWQHKLSPLECFAMEACLWRDLRALRYPLRFAHAVWRPVLDTTGWLLRTLAPLLSRSVRHMQRRGYFSRTVYF